jgi:hypothetical protein
MTLGFLRGSCVPPHAAVTPRKKIAREKIQATCEFDHPKVPLNSRTSSPWKKLQAYTVPRQSMRTVAIEAMSQRVALFSVVAIICLRYQEKVALSMRQKS